MGENFSKIGIDLKNKGKLRVKVQSDMVVVWLIQHLVIRLPSLVAGGVDPYEYAPGSGGPTRPGLPNRNQGGDEYMNTE